MINNIKSRGFITIATGKEEYYQLAENLLKSYRCFSKNPLPFAILCDRENNHTVDFDNVIVFENGSSNSYLDKLCLGDYIPYDENIFIDADCLAFGDLNKLFDYFQRADDFSCFGRVLPLEDKSGWFEYDNIGKLQNRVSYVIGLHGGIYFMRKGAVVEKVFDEAKSFISDYASFNFKGEFETPGDEPLVALSMAINDCRPIPFRLEAICCYWECLKNISIDITEGKALIHGDSYINTILVHWGTRFTKGLEYKKQVELLNIIRLNYDDQNKRIMKCKKKYAILFLTERINKLTRRIYSKIKRTIHV